MRGGSVFIHPRTTAYLRQNNNDDDTTTKIYRFSLILIVLCSPATPSSSSSLRLGPGSLARRDFVAVVCVTTTNAPTPCERADARECKIIVFFAYFSSCVLCVF